MKVYFEAVAPSNYGSFLNSIPLKISEPIIVIIRKVEQFGPLTPGGNWQASSRQYRPLPRVLVASNMRYIIASCGTIGLT